MPKRYHDRVNVLDTYMELRVKVDRLPTSCTKCPFKRSISKVNRHYDPKLKVWTDLSPKDVYTNLCCRYMMKVPEKEFTLNWRQYAESTHENLENHRWSKCPLYTV